MSLDNSGVLQWADSGEEFNLINVPDCDVLVDIEASQKLAQYDVQWHRIPITGIDQWINKSGPAAINRTTKVKAMNDVLVGQRSNIPTYALVGDVNPDSQEKPLDEYTLDAYFNTMLFDRDPEENDDGFVQARVWMYDSETDEYRLTQHGYVGSFGPTSNSLERKFWIYDPADLLRDIPVGITFSDPNVRQLLSFIINGDDDTGNAVGVEKTTPFTVSSVVFPKQNELASRSVQSAEIDRIFDLDQFENVLETAIGTFTNPLKSAGVIKELLTSDTKKFTRNRNNLVDVLSLLMDIIDGVWYFEPAPSGIELHIRSNWNKNDYGRQLVDNSIGEADEGFGVTVKENTALSDIKPINTIAVNGDSVRTLPNGDQEASGPTVLTGESFTESYPYVKLRYDPLYRAAGNRELGPTDVESDATDLNAAENDAYNEFIEHIEETTEGRIELFGDPMPVPYDFITAKPACLGGEVTGDVPIEYSINDVHHQRHAGEHFITELGVHAAVKVTDENGDSNFTVEREYRQAQ